MDILTYIDRIEDLYGNVLPRSKKVAQMYPWDRSMNPPWMAIPSNPESQKIFLEEFDETKATMHAEGGLALPKSNTAGINVVDLSGGKSGRPNKFRVQIRGTTDAEGKRPLLETKEFYRNKQDIKAAKDYIKKLKITYKKELEKIGSPQATLAEVLESRKDIKQENTQTLINRIKELVNNPKYKKVKQIEQQLYKDFNKPEYTQKKQGDIFFDNKTKTFQLQKDYEIEGNKIGKKKLSERGPLLRQIIGVEAFNSNNPNFKNVSTLLTKFFTQDPKNPTFDPSEAERTIMRKFLQDTTLNQSKKGGVSKSFFEKNLFNLKNQLKSYHFIQSTGDKITKALLDPKLDSKTRVVYQETLNKIKDNKNRILQQVKSKVPNLFTKYSKSGSLQLEHRLAQGLQYSGGFKYDLKNLGRATYVPGRFNQAKFYNYDAPLIKLVDGYNSGTLEEKKLYKKDIEKLNKDFNKRTKGYLNPVKFKFGNVISITDTTPFIKDIKTDVDLLKDIDKNIKHSNAYFKSFGKNKIKGLGNIKPETAIISGKNYDNFKAFVKKQPTAMQELMSRKGSLADPTLLAKAGYEEFLKPTARFAGKVLTSKPVTALASPTAMAGASASLLAENPSDPFGYAALTGMGVSSKRIADKIKTPFLQKALTLGADPARIAKLARFTTPFGIAATGVASIVDIARKAQKEFDALSPEEQKEYLAEQEQFAEDLNRDEFLSYAGGGIVGIRRPSAIPPKKGPQYRGLDYLKYYGR